MTTTTTLPEKTATTVPKKDAGPNGHVDDKALAGAEEIGPGTKVDRSLEMRVDHVSLEEATAKGKAARLAVPRSLHAGWAPPAGRRSPVEVIAEQATSREPDLVPIRHGRMMVSPFTFYRGAAAVMAADLAATPVSGLRGPAVRGCPPAQLRGVRLARTLDAV